MVPAKQSVGSAGATRRAFLKASAAGAAALGTLSIARGAHAAGTETIKIGMIGCGGRCSGAAHESLKAGPYVKLAAMCDIFSDRLQAARNNLKGDYPAQVAVDDAHCFVGFDGYQKVIDSVDVVLIACAVEVPPDVRRGGDPLGQTRLCGETARHRPCGRAADAGRLRPG